MENKITITSPGDQSIVAKRTLATNSEIKETLSSTLNAQAQWQAQSIGQRSEYCLQAIDWFMQNQDELAKEISQQMGRPIQSAAGEIRGVQERALHMISLAEAALKDSPLPAKAGFKRFVRPTPLGSVMVIAPWNYPYLTAINSIIPALMSGNCVILKHSAQTLLCAERFAQAFKSAGLPSGVFQFLHMNHHQTLELVRHPVIKYVHFTGSVEAGRVIEKSAAGLFKGIALELGGKDAAYVREDAALGSTIDNLVDGAFYNSGQSCCGIERIYVHESLYEEFVKGFVAQANELVLGDPLDVHTTLGPMVSVKSADIARQQIRQAKKLGAVCHIDEGNFIINGQFTHKKDTPNKSIAKQAHSNYLPPQVLTNVTHEMDIMSEESFAPVVGIMKVKDDAQAVQLINDSIYGLTASLWSKDQDTCILLGDQIETGTVFMNRCDYLDPALPWVGVKDSGRGCSLSKWAYQQLTRPKSFHFKKA